VLPLLDGRPVGYFIFDTGASGFVIDPAAAEQLGLEAFGELQARVLRGWG
jgi:predicted aspartyl protease